MVIKDLTLRDFFAASALTGLLASQTEPAPVGNTVTAAFYIADEMLAERDLGETAPEQPDFMGMLINSLKQGNE